jgi:hypothetical protein
MAQIGTRIQFLGNFGSDAQVGTISVLSSGMVTIEWDNGRREVAPAALLSTPRFKIVG